MPTGDPSSGDADRAAKRVPSADSSTTSLRATGAPPDISGIGGSESSSKHTRATIAQPGDQFDPAPDQPSISASRRCPLKAAQPAAVPSCSASRIVGSAPSSSSTCTVAR